MKHLYLFALILSTAFSVSAQSYTWTEQNNTGENLWGVGFATEDIGFAGGNFSEFYRTTDGGNTWTIDSSVYYGTVRGFQFITPNEGWMVSSSLYHTIDGGMTWTNEHSNVGHTAFDMFFVDQQTGFVEGSGKFSRTTDGGQTWTQVHNFGMNFGITDIHFKDNLNGCITTHDGELYRTCDGGLSWTMIFTEVNINFKVVRMLGNTIWLGGGTDTCPSYFHLWKSDDDGQNFMAQAVDPNLGAVNDMAVLQGGTHIYLALGSLCSASKGSVLRSTDSGFSWVEDILPNAQPLACMYVHAVNNLWVSGHDGQINALKTSVGIDEQLDVNQLIRYDPINNQLILTNQDAQLLGAFNMLGSQVHVNRSTNTSFAVSNVSRGVYLAQVQLGQQRGVLRFVVE